MKLGKELKIHILFWNGFIESSSRSVKITLLRFSCSKIAIQVFLRRNILNF